MKFAWHIKATICSLLLATPASGELPNDYRRWADVRINPENSTTTYLNPFSQRTQVVREFSTSLPNVFIVGYVPFSSKDNPLEPSMEVYLRMGERIISMPSEQTFRECGRCHKRINNDKL